MSDRWIDGAAWQELIAGHYDVPVPDGCKLDPLVISGRSWTDFHVAKIYRLKGSYSPDWMSDGCGGPFLAVWLGPSWIDNKRAWRPFWELFTSLHSAEQYCESLLNDLKLGNHGL